MMMMIDDMDEENEAGRDGFPLSREWQKIAAAGFHFQESECGESSSLFGF